MPVNRNNFGFFIFNSLVNSDEIMVEGNCFQAFLAMIDNGNFDKAGPLTGNRHFVSHSLSNQVLLAGRQSRTCCQVFPLPDLPLVNMESLIEESTVIPHSTNGATIQGAIYPAGALIQGKIFFSKLRNNLDCLSD